MKIYLVKTGRPNSTKRKEFACLSAKRTDCKMVDSQKGKGVPFATWKELEFIVYNPRDPKPDFFGYSLEIVCSQRARDIALQPLERSGELLRLTVKSLEGFFYLYNCTTVIDALDAESSIWEYSKNTKRFELEVPSFHGRRLQDATIFKFLTFGLTRFYTVERTGDYKDGEFKALVEHHGLNGLEFEMVWTDTDGPVPPKRVYDPEDPLEFRIGRKLP
jgi:hypothetical protein